MIKHNSHGFTLVELLAVIVILALIVIVAIPNVMNASNSSKKEALKVYANRMLSSAEELVMKGRLEGNKNKYCHKVGTVSDGAPNLDCCFSMTELGLDGGGKYIGSVIYVNDTFKVLVYSENEFMTYHPGTYTSNCGITREGLDNTDNIIPYNSSNQYSFNNCGRAASY